MAFPARGEVDGDGNGITISGWSLRVSKGPILNKDEIVEWESALFTLPEMIFGNTSLHLTHAPSGLKIDLTARAALQCLVGQAASAELPYADKWKDKGGMDTVLFGPVQVQEFNYDWTYATNYNGTLTAGNEGAQAPEVVEGGEGINVDMLKRPDPILFFDELVLYEDELADNGTCKLSVKLRVMPTCWFVLMRMYLRVDQVLVRVVDTRFFHAYGTNHVVRERKVCQADFKTLRQVAEDVRDDQGMNGPYADPNLLMQHLEVVEVTNEHVQLPGQPS